MAPYLRLLVQEAATLVAHQITQSNNTQCKSDATRKLTLEAPDSRLFGVGRIHAFDGMCVRATGSVKFVGCGLFCDNVQ